MPQSGLLVHVGEDDNRFISTRQAKVFIRAVRTTKLLTVFFFAGREDLCSNEAHLTCNSAVASRLGVDSV
jgi:hypothetical protein